MKSIRVALVCALLVIGPLPALAACVNPPAAPTGWWLGDGNGDDSVGNLDATSIDGATFGTGYVGSGAFQFDGSDDYASVADDPALDAGTGDFTVNFWVNLAADGGEMVMVEKFNENDGSTGWTLARRFGSVYFAGGCCDVQTSVSIDVGVWTHIAMRRSSGTLTLFKDGSAIHSMANAGNFDNPHELLFGRRRGGQGFFWNGRIDEIQLHVGTALSDAEILAIYNAGSDGQCTTCTINGVPDPGEQCDDGNLVDGDGCDSNCRFTGCGNGILTSGEACEDGNLTNGDGCDSNCTLTACGNGIPTGTEQCDDGNAVAGDGCRADCTVEACGDGTLDAGETCEDGNLTNGDGCDTNCTPTACGNGVRTAAEECDDGNSDAGDGCESDCTYTPVSENLPPGGGTVTTDPGGVGATPEVPTQISLATTAGGLVTINSASSTVEVDGVQLVGVTFQIEAPPLTPADPLVITFTVDPSVLPPGFVVNRLQMIRDHVPFNDCSSPTAASPDPCLASLVQDVNGDVEITVRSSHASLWQLAVRGQSEDEQDCTNAINAAGVKVAKAQGKVDGKCLKKASKGSEPNAQGCLTADHDGKVAKAQLKTSVVEADKCTPAPPFAFTGASSVNTAAATAPIDLVSDLFGANLNAAVISGGAGSKCQGAVLKASQKILEAKARLFLDCKKDALAGRTTLAVTGPQLGACFDVVAADGNGKVAKAAGKLAKALEAKCVGVNVGTALPGPCFLTADPIACVSTRAQCRLCQMFDAMDGLSADCDSIDDQQANGSCP